MAEMGREGGRVKVSKGFASKAVRDKALETRKLRRAEKKLKESQEKP